MSKLLKKTDPLLSPLATSKYILLSNRLQSIVDPDDHERLGPHYWRAKRKGNHFYAYRRRTIDGKEQIIFMHREIMNTPNNMECHHRNRNTLDNRRINLANLFPDVHRNIHKGIYD